MSSDQSRPDRSLVPLLALLAVSAGVLIVSAMLLRSDSEVTLPSARSQEQPAQEAQTTRVALEQSDPVPRRHESSAELIQRLIQCRQRDTGLALADVRLYRRTQSLAGPSDSAGSLAIEGEMTGQLTLWAAGWDPVRVRGETLPEEVLFDASTAKLEVRLLNSTSEHHLLRSLVQPHLGGASPEDPWIAPLAERAPDVWVTEQIAPGTYDVYVWMTLPNGEVRTFSRSGVQVESENTTELSFDLDDPRDPEEFESDS